MIFRKAPINSYQISTSGGGDNVLFAITGNYLKQEGIIKTLLECTSLSLEETLDRLFSDSNDFTKGSGRQDDTSIVLLEHRVDSRS